MSEQSCRIEILNGLRQSCDDCLLQVQLDVEEQLNGCEHEMISTQSYRFRFKESNQIDWYVEHSDGWKKWGTAQVNDEQSMYLEAQQLLSIP